MLDARQMDREETAERRARAAWEEQQRADRAAAPSHGSPAEENAGS